MHVSFTIGLVTLRGVFTIALRAQDRGAPMDMRARELFYGVKRTEAVSSGTTTPGGRNTPSPSVSGPTPPASPGPPSTTPRGTLAPPSGRNVSAPLALRYKVLKWIRSEFQEVDTDTTFSSGDQIKVSVAVNDMAYVYIAQFGSSGTWKILFPSNDAAIGTNRIQAYESVEIPPRDQAFQFDSRPGVGRLFIAVSREPIANLEQIISGSRKSQPQPRPAPSERPPVQIVQNFSPVEISPSVVSGLLRSRDLVVTKYDTNTIGSVEHAVYLANAKDADGPVITEMRLTHQP